MRAARVLVRPAGLIGDKTNVPIYQMTDRFHIIYPMSVELEG